ncbi:MAG: tRNA (N6-isopentenyl adenosine(37)-C2)-methylthiotransferase MiaB [Erysipelotrichaceae bacterium]|nr:tRNA (N6-isopentenyl adenosine(37)-C2)-methylthiotransferase MiaB [Erysipelotrichaceae bacterium]
MKKRKVNILNTPSLDEARKRSIGIAPLIYADIKVSPLVREFARGKKYYLRTYGCQANVRDSETLMGLLEEAGFVQSDNYNDAHVIILNTCAIRENAETKVFGEIGSLKAIKRNNPDAIIALGGCMSQQEVVVDEIIKKYPQVDLVFGTHNLSFLLEYIDEILKKRERLVSVASITGEVIENLPAVRMDKYKAYVNIIYGCDKFCSYCIVPYTRGRERSRLPEHIIEECQSLIDQGYQEITLLGQNVNAYGKDLGNEYTFADLLDEVAKLGIPRLRFVTSHPWDFSDEMIEVIAKHKNIMNYIHLPLQSGSNEILRKMGRRYTVEAYLNLVSKIRKHLPNVSLSTDIIVGFPNETEAQFEETLEVIKQVGFDSAFTFIYSARAGTPAAKLDDDVSKEEKHRRFNKLTKTLEVSIEKSSESMVGKTYDVLVDSISKRDDNMLSGYTEGSKLVHFPGDESLIGEIIPIKIIESKTYSLRGEIDESPL